VFKKLTTYVIVSNEDYLLRYLLKICLKKYNEVKLKDRSYKVLFLSKERFFNKISQIFCKNIDANSETLEFYITIFKVDDEANAIEFTKKQVKINYFLSLTNFYIYFRVP